MTQNPRFIAGIVRRDAQFGAICQNAGKRRQGSRRNDAPLVMPGLWPGVREKHESALNRGLRQGGQQQPCIVAEQPDITETRPIYIGQQTRNAIDKRLAADKTDFRVFPCLPGQMLTGAKSDFEPDRTRVPCKQGVGIQLFRFRIPVASGQRDFDLRQQPVDQNLAAGAERSAEAPTVQRPLRSVAQLNADFSVSAISVFSQAKPPSASGWRPK